MLVAVGFVLKYCILIGLQYFCSRTNPGIGLVSDLLLFAKVGLHPTNRNPCHARIRKGTPLKTSIFEHLPKTITAPSI